ncbi:MAG: oxidoreductase [Puniceicoccaceae bacterium]|nr:MAG: oxidoreductase [Puniceicoccaceae bacterium]
MSDVLANTVSALPIMLPLIGGLLCFLLPTRWRAAVGLAFSGMTLAGVVTLTWVLVDSGISGQSLGGWPAPLGIQLNFDGLACVFLLLTALVGLPVGVFAAAFFAGEDTNGSGPPLFWPLWLILWAALNGIFLSGDLFNLYVLLEIMGIAAVSLAILSGKTSALRAGLRYFFAALVGSMLYLLGVALIYGATGTLDIGLLGERLPGDALTIRVAFALMVVGLLIKTALFPLHFWLPEAHSSAPAPVSAILSALVVKASFYLLLRLWVDVFDGSVTYAAGQALGVLGAVAMVWGSYQALRQTQLKRMVAHSTVGQIGYMFLLFPLITLDLSGSAEAPWLVHAWTGGIYQALAHGFAKAAMFLSVGIFILAAGEDDKSIVNNMVGRLPMTTFAFALAGVSLIGLPPSGGFVAKWMLLKATFSSGQWWWAPMIVWGSFLTAGYVFMILRLAFAPSGEAPTEKLRPVPGILQVMALALGIGAIVIGFRAEEVMALLDIEAPFAEMVEVDTEGGGDD